MINHRDTAPDYKLRIQELLGQFWGFSTFRPLQEEIILSILSGKDVLALLPTGGGKSICYQIPALCSDGLCLVISPLIALMKDQVEQLRKKNITAFAIYAGMSRKEVINTLKVAGESNCKFLYLSPERLESALFKEYLPGLGVNLIAVDEAHCVSQWGYDFRPPYLRISSIRDELPGIPVLALTASATPDVQEDIINKLDFKEKIIFKQSFERANLSYSVFKIDSKINKILEILQKVSGSSLVYCKSRKRTKEISDRLLMHGIKSDYYHAGLTNEVRSQKQESWINNNISTMVCTNAFGMGIDKPDVRVVIHADLPDCLENYYQEAGRAGRDGKKSYAVLLYQENEPGELEQLAETRFPAIERIREMYQSIINYLQLPAGSGEGNYYDFDMIDFLKKFNGDANLVWAAIKTLELENVLSYNEQFFLPSTVQFICKKERLYQFEKEDPSLEPLLKILLRTYEGIFDYPVRVYERSISFLLNIDVDTVKMLLQKLRASRIVCYEQQKDSPQLFFPVNRVAVEHLSINNQNYQQRKTQFSARVAVLLNYALTETSCRSSFIAAYFGDHAVKACGICDNCLKKNKKDLRPEEFEKISAAILSIPRTKTLTVSELLKQLNTVSKEKIWQVIHFLQSENKLEADAENNIRIK
ncbi:MAG: ATP-dependent DNA helicase RecQ [Chitinophagaceae bacterium]